MNRDAAVSGRPSFRTLSSRHVAQVATCGKHHAVQRGETPMKTDERQPRCDVVVRGASAMTIC
jgi:hypothetical protein